VLHAPTSLAEASSLLASYGGEARAIAGGTALVLMIRQGLVEPAALVRLDRIPQLNTISVEGGVLRLGALATLRDVALSPLVQQHAPVLAETCNLVGNVRVRNAATVGGNVCEADYASDPPGVLTALDARARVQGPSGTREVPISELITDFYETSLAPEELVSDVLVPIPPSDARGVYLKYITRSSEDRPCVGTTALLRLDDGGRIGELRVAVGAVAGKPLRLPEVEATAAGELPSEEIFRHLGERYAEAAEPVSDVRGSAGYRRRMIVIFVRRALAEAHAGRVGARKV
jgi:aerobic carbon-monoxide dehydrogenase medium subunit